jgi:hypothetical protein
MYALFRGYNTPEQGAGDWFFANLAQLLVF